MDHEKRQSQRYTFPKEHPVILVLADAEGDESLEVVLLNISKTGLGLACKRKLGASLPIHENSILSIDILHKSLPFLEKLHGQRVHVKWILDYEQLENIAFGCAFLAISEECTLQIESFIEERME